MQLTNKRQVLLRMFSSNEMKNVIGWHHGMNLTMNTKYICGESGVLLPIEVTGSSFKGVTGSKIGVGTNQK